MSSSDGTLNHMQESQLINTLATPVFIRKGHNAKMNIQAVIKNFLFILFKFI
jgi:hypothetical protein